tara:strand:- start:215 stop:589 length:375 start_codon:yes stop_codon:yes gene_type:complete
MGKIKGKRAGLQVLNSVEGLKQTTTHKLYDTNIVTIENHVTEYTNVILNSGGWQTKHTKNCMNDVLDQFNLKVIQKDFSWFLVDNHNTIAWDFEDNMNLGISFDNNGDMTIVRWGLTYNMKRKA